MADYVRYGISLNLLAAYSGEPLAQTLIAHSPTQFSLRNGDGSVTSVSGLGFAWNAATGKFIAGSVTGLRHEAGGQFIDEIVGLDHPVSGLQAVLEEIEAFPLRVHDFLFSGDDVLDARLRADGAVAPVTLWGMAGDDEIRGGGGKDLLIGGMGADTLAGGAAGDTLFGEDGDDVLAGGARGDKLFGGFGDDRLVGGAGRDIFHGAGGNDTVNGNGGSDLVVHHSSWAETSVTQQGSRFIVESYSGTDTIANVGRIATDTGVYRWTVESQSWERVSGTPGEVFLHPSARLRGSNASDAIDVVDTDKTVVEAGAGNDTVTCGDGFDLVLGGTGRDSISGDTAETTSSDRLYGQTGGDVLSGGAGDDRLYGGSGADRLRPGDGFDVLTGGSGSDVFEFRWSTGGSTGESWGHDVIVDFVVGIDHLDLRFGPFESGPPSLMPDLVQTERGLLILLAGAGTITLEGVNGAGLTLDDLLI